MIVLLALLPRLASSYEVIHLLDTQPEELSLTTEEGKENKGYLYAILRRQRHSLFSVLELFPMPLERPRAHGCDATRRGPMGKESGPLTRAIPC